MGAWLARDVVTPLRHCSYVAAVWGQNFNEGSGSEQCRNGEFSFDRQKFFNLMRALPQLGTINAATRSESQRLRFFFIYALRCSK